MKTQALITTSTFTANSERSAPGTTMGKTPICGLEKDSAIVSKERRPYLHQVRPERLRAFPKPHRWGVVLAGGDGVRLQELTRWLYGDNRPKQFCRLIGTRTLLEEARQRAERSLAAEQILFSLQRSHEDYYLPYLAEQPSQRIVQPFNKGTAPAILAALIRIAQADSEAIVSILPCDHYYSSEKVFTATLESAMAIAEHYTGSVVLLGAQPTGPEVEFGWIETGEAIVGRSELFRVRGFQEKPARPLAETLYRTGSLWNTFVMVGHVRAFLEMTQATAPRLLQVLESQELTASGAEIRIPDSIYDGIAPTDFSRHVLTPSADRLLTLQLGDVEWSDLGDPYRVLVALTRSRAVGQPLASVLSQPVKTAA